MSEWREFEFHFITGEQASLPEQQKKRGNLAWLGKVHQSQSSSIPHSTVGHGRNRKVPWGKWQRTQALSISTSARRQLQSASREWQSRAWSTPSWTITCCCAWLAMWVQGTWTRVSMHAQQHYFQALAIKLSCSESCQLPTECQPQWTCRAAFLLRTSLAKAPSSCWNQGLERFP